MEVTTLYPRRIGLRAKRGVLVRTHLRTAFASSKLSPDSPRDSASAARVAAGSSILRREQCDCAARVADEGGNVRHAPGASPL
jgi:hypothetical protein